MINWITFISHASENKKKCTQSKIDPYWIVIKTHSAGKHNLQKYQSWKIAKAEAKTNQPRKITPQNNPKHIEM